MEEARLFSDIELIENLRSGRMLNESVKSVYRSYFELLSRYILSNNGSLQDAEDIFQEVVVNFIDLVRKNKFRGEATIKTFLYVMNKNTWLNELKKRQRTANRELKYDRAQDDVEMDVAHFIAGREVKKEVLNMVNRLGEACKKVLLLFYYENLSIKEILENTGYENEQVVRNKKYKCLKQLEQIIGANPASMQTLKNLFNG
ncbi:MAG: hypothetical protein JWM28_304 [Chitinophagaceae bacterium]|nr:hypothetical protein [Chitinophagaceae bacterium]